MNAALDDLEKEPPEGDIGIYEGSERLYYFPYVQIEKGSRGILYGAGRV